MSSLRVLFVCMGNICRSPAAEGVFRAVSQKAGLADRVEIASAGTIGYHEGNLPDSRMREAASRRGIELVSRARKFRRDDFSKHDLIIPMDDDNRDDILAMAADEAARSKVRPFCGFCSHFPDTQVPDPYYGGPEGFEHVLDLLEDGSVGLLAEVRGRITPGTWRWDPAAV